MQFGREADYGGRAALNKLHFREINWVIYFPTTGNTGSALERYGVAYRDRSSGVGQTGTRINLGDVLAMDPVARGYPHQVGHFVESVGRGPDWTPRYLRFRTVNDRAELEEFIREIEQSPVPTTVVVPPPAPEDEEPGSVLLSVAEMPAFRRSRHVELVRRLSKGHTAYFLHCRASALPEGSHPEYTSEGEVKWERSLPTEDALALLSLARSAIPVYTRQFSTWLDGTGYELSFGDKFSGARFAWSMSAPEEWRPLEEVTQRLLHLAGELDPSGAYF